jgi:osmotically-inducible protein OsmY
MRTFHLGAADGLVVVLLLGFAGGTAHPTVAAGVSLAVPAIHHHAEYVDDATITAEVKNVILRDPAVNPSKLQVETIRGVVQLIGFVKTSDQSAAAAKDAAGIRGVETVQNNLIVRSPEPLR